MFQSPPTSFSSSKSGCYVLFWQSQVYSKTLVWLVISIPPKNMKVNWDDDIPNLWENKSHVPNHQPVVDVGKVRKIKLLLFNKSMEDSRSQAVDLARICSTNYQAGQQAGGLLEWQKIILATQPHFCDTFLVDFPGFPMAHLEEWDTRIHSRKLTLLWTIPIYTDTGFTPKKNGD